MGRIIQRSQTNSIDFSQRNRLEQYVDLIKSGEVLLVIGKNFELNAQSKDSQTGEFIYRNGENLYDYILRVLNDEYGTDAKDFTEFSYLGLKMGNTQFPLNVHDEICRVIEESQLSLSDVSPQLLSLIETGYFRFVLTTTFDPLVEIAMKKHFGSVRVMSLLNRNPGNREIDSALDLNTPTIYYLFGAADNSGQDFVATDNDALKFLKKWQEKTDSKLLGTIRQKGLLTLGCDYDDWLFRFILYTIYDLTSRKACVCDFQVHKNLERYLQQNNILIEHDVYDFVNKLIARLSDRNELQIVPADKCDVFISYSREDKAYADDLYAKLEQRGLKVWYDKYNLAGKGQQYMERIYNAIDQCSVFVPLLTPTIAKQFGEAHPYREEWERAHKQQIQRGLNCDYCIPVCNEGFNIFDEPEPGVVDMWLRDRDVAIHKSFDVFAEEISLIVHKGNK